MLDRIADVLWCESAGQEHGTWREPHKALTYFPIVFTAGSTQFRYGRRRASRIEEERVDIRGIGCDSIQRSCIFHVNGLYKSKVWGAIVNVCIFGWIDMVHHLHGIHFAEDRMFGDIFAAGLLGKKKGRDGRRCMPCDLPNELVGDHSRS